MDALTEELKRLDKQGAVRELSEAEVERTKAWTPLIVKQKPNGKWRMITDLRSLNGCFRTAKFKQQTWKTIRGVLELSGAKWGTKLDVREFFHHLGLCRETQRWVRFQGKEGKYQAKAMPFGLAASPFWANKFAKVLQAALNKKKINHLWYVDDVLVLGDTAQQCAEKTNEALQILDNLGVQLNKEKCELEPKEQVEYLGMNIDLKNGCIAALTSRLNAVCREVTKLKHAGSTCATRLARVAGKLEYLQVGMPSAIGLGKQLMFEAGKLAEKHGWMKTTTKNDKVHGLLKTIQQALKITTPNPINRPWKQKSNLTTDASDFGWGAVLEGPKMKKTSRGLFSRQEVREHITRKEVFAIELAVRNSDRSDNRSVPSTSVTKCLLSYSRLPESTVLTTKCRVSPGEESFLLLPSSISLSMTLSSTRLLLLCSPSKLRGDFVRGFLDSNFALPIRWQTLLSV